MPINHTIALAGNPNVGKTTLFNSLTGLRQHTGNWSGKTVGLATGRFDRDGKGYRVVDLPGTYSLAAHSPEEEAARDFLVSNTADATVVVCDATCLERGMCLVLQTVRLTDSVVICLNLMDEAKKKGIAIDTSLLSSRTGLPVVATTARAGRSRSLSALVDACDAVITSPPTPVVTPIPEGMKITDDIEATSIAIFAEQLCDGVVTRLSDGQSDRDRRIDRIITGRKTALPLMLLLLLGVLWLTISGANYPSELLSRLFGQVETRLSDALMWLNCPDWLRALTCEGILRTLGWVVAVMLPPMAIFFPLFTILEDLGYLPRVAFNLDHHFKRACACGKQALTMWVGNLWRKNGGKPLSRCPAVA